MRNANSGRLTSQTQGNVGERADGQLNVALGNSDIGRECRANGRYVGTNTQHVLVQIWREGQPRRKLRRGEEDDIKMVD